MPPYLEGAESISGLGSRHFSDLGHRSGERTCKSTPVLDVKPVLEQSGRAQNTRLAHVAPKNNFIWPTGTPNDLYFSKATYNPRCFDRSQTDGLYVSTCSANTLHPLHDPSLQDLMHRCKLALVQHRSNIYAHTQRLYLLFC